MPKADRVPLFDDWAKIYDDLVEASEGFPFTGYRDVLRRVVNLAQLGPGTRVLELVTGTGNLAERFIQAGAKVWGLDFSTAMLEEARTKVSSATLLQADLLGEWPLLPKFERVVSAYVLHEFDLAAKLNVLTRSAEQLGTGGSLIIADIAFPNIEFAAQAHEYWRNVWDEDEHYGSRTRRLPHVKRSG